MSQSIVRTIHLDCDGCGSEVYEASGADTVAEARRDAARDNGWAYVTMTLKTKTGRRRIKRDLCPDCKSESKARSK